MDYITELHLVKSYGRGGAYEEFVQFDRKLYEKKTNFERNYLKMLDSRRVSYIEVYRINKDGWVLVDTIYKKNKKD